ncbi:MAG: Arm DNA-binding domain-containing protein [Deltaproteobacteria bacterium]|nr:Arm DNA-binding domain-containing protein [Deltaproteobacteria bacterium]
MPLTETFIKSIKENGETRSFTDGHGLKLEVHKNGASYWKLKYYKFRKSTIISLGKCPQVSVKEARLKAAQFKLESKDNKKKSLTFGALAIEWLELEKNKTT